jgi:hypothetical protein
MTTGCSSAAPQQHNSRYVTLRNFAGHPPPSIGQGYLFPKTPASLITALDQPPCCNAGNSLCAQIRRGTSHLSPALLLYRLRYLVNWRHGASFSALERNVDGATCTPHTCSSPSILARDSNPESPLRNSAVSLLHRHVASVLRIDYMSNTWNLRRAILCQYVTENVIDNGWLLRSEKSPPPWTGAPCSPQRTWAENGIFKCFHCMRDNSCPWPKPPPNSIVGKGYAPSFRPMYAGEINSPELPGSISGSETQSRAHPTDSLRPTRQGHSIRARRRSCRLVDRR